MDTATRKKKRRKIKKISLNELASLELTRLSLSKKIEEDSLLLDKHIRSLLFHFFQKPLPENAPKITSSSTKKTEEITDKVLEEKKPRARKGDEGYRIKPGEIPPVYTARHAGAMDYVPHVDYDQLFSHMGARAEKLPGATYTPASLEAKDSPSGEHAGPMTYQEGADVVNRVNISLNLQVYDNISADEKERFEYWKIFNKHLRRIYDHASVVRGARDGASFKPMIHRAKT